MFSVEVIGNDDFLDMPAVARDLYIHLNIYADDDGFVNPRKIIRMVGSNEESLELLLEKKFIIGFESGVVVISHWKLNNYLRSDRYKQTIYQSEYKKLTCLQNVYQMSTVGIPNVIPRLGKDRLGYKNVVVVANAKQQENSSTEEKPKKIKCPNTAEGHKGCIEFINSVGESRGATFANYGKQIRGLHMMLMAKYTFDQINKQIDYMENDMFWKAKGFDLMTVANEIGKGGEKRGFKV